jgi:hypothetical protein
MFSLGCSESHQIIPSQVEVLRTRLAIYWETLALRSADVVHAELVYFNYMEHFLWWIGLTDEPT